MNGLEKPPHRPMVVQLVPILKNCDLFVYHRDPWLINGMKLIKPITGWWGQPTPLKNDGVRQWLSDDIPDMENKPYMFETTNQSFF